MSIIILTHNAPEYVKRCITSMQITSYKNFEIVVVDNASDSDTKNVLSSFKKQKQIQKLVLLPQNNFFAKGNNIGASHANSKAKYLVFLNSDTEIKNKDWLTMLVSHVPVSGIISWGYARLPILRPDGWCFLIDKQIFINAGKLNERFPFNWSITELTINVLRLGFGVRVLQNADEYIVHYGGKSRQLVSIKRILQNAPKLSVRQVVDGFRGHNIEVFTAKNPSS